MARVRRDAIATGLAAEASRGFLAARRHKSHLGKGVAAKTDRAISPKAFCR